MREKTQPKIDLESIPEATRTVHVTLPESRVKLLDELIKEGKPQRIDVKATLTRIVDQGITNIAVTLRTGKATAERGLNGKSAATT